MKPSQNARTKVHAPMANPTAHDNVRLVDLQQ